VFQNFKDGLVFYKGTEKFYERAASKDKKYVRFGKDGFPFIHVLTFPNNPKMNEMFEQIEEFGVGGKNAD